MNKLNPIKYIENMISHHPKSLSLWITEGIVIDNKRYIIKEFRLRDGKLFAVIAEDKYKPKYFEVQLCPDEETLKEIYKAIEENKIAIEKEVTDRKNEINRVDSAIKANTTKINQEITDRKNEINRVDKNIEANTAKINQEITDRQNDISRVNEAISANTAKINKEITDRQNEISRVDGAINANTAKINKEIKDRKDEITRVEGKIPTEIGGTNHYAISKDSKTAISSYFSDVKRDVTTGIISGKITGVYPYFGVAVGVGRTYQETYGQKIPVIQGKSIAVTFSNSLFNKNYVSYFGSDDVTIKGYNNKGASRFIIPASDLVGVSYITLRYGLADGTAYVGQTIETKVKVEYDSVYTDWSPAPEDTTEQISSLSSEIKQTADGMTLLATKTELNTLSGRVTNAENNITAKANELTSKITSVEGKIPTSVGAVNLFKGSRDFSGSWLNGGSGVYAEEYQGVKIFKRQNVWNGLSQYFEVKTGEEYVFSAYVKSNAKTDTVNFYLAHEPKQPMAEGIVSFGSDNSQDIVSIGLTDKYQRIAVKIKITKDGWMAPRIERYNSDAYLFFGGYKLERGNIATDWSPAPEDTTEQISSLSSQIQQTADGITLLATKTELNTLSGRVTNAENNITAKANELTSKITSVEGKIPSNVSTRNLILKSNDFANPHKQAGDSKTTVSSTNDYFVVRSTGYTADGWGGISWNMSISEVKDGEQFSILMPVYIDSSVPLDNGWGFALKNHPSNLAAYYSDIPTNKKDQWFNVAITFKAYNNVVFDTYPFYVYLNRNGLVRIKPPMLVRGNLIPSDYQPAFEDAASDVTKLNTTLTQTADGLKQLSTKVTSQGNTITSHTNSINSLTTGLQAKVSQSDFDTLSGRVTTAENNIIAKANELSSKITSVEGKIPTSVGGRNLAQGTSKDWSTPVTGFSGSQNTCFDLYKVITDGLAVGDTIKTRIVLKYTNIVPASGKTAEIRVQGYGNVTDWGSGAYPGSNNGGVRSISGSGQIVFELTDKITADHLRNDYWNWAFRTDWIASGSLQWRLAKVERGMFFTDWSPAPEDYYSKLSKLEEKVAELQGKAYKKINIETTDYTGYYSVYDGKVIKYDVTAKDGKYLDLRNFTFSDGKGPITGVTFDSNSLMVIYKIYDDQYLHKLVTYDNFAKFSINDQNKIVIDPSSTSELLRNNLDKVTSFSYVTMDPNYEY